MLARRSKSAISEKEIAIFKLRKVLFPEKHLQELPGASHLSEKLQLCTSLVTRILTCPISLLEFTTTRTPENQTHADMCMLDLITVCLTTGRLGDVVTAAFDKREHVSLVLAKNGDVLPAD